MARLPIAEPTQTQQEEPIPEPTQTGCCATDNKANEEGKAKTGYTKAIGYAQALPISNYIPLEQISLVREAIRTAIRTAFMNGHLEGYRLGHSVGYSKGEIEGFREGKTRAEPIIPDLKELREKTTTYSYEEISSILNCGSVLRRAEEGLYPEFNCTSKKLAFLYRVSLETVMNAFRESQRRRKAGFYEPTIDSKS